MTRVIHTGDTHLGYQQYHSPERRQDFLDAFGAVVDDAIEDDVDAVVHAGDLFHDRRPELVDILGTLSVLRDLDDAGIPFLAVVGNHEVKRDAQWLDLFASLGLATRLGDDPVVVGDTAFYGLDYVPKSKRPDLEYRFTDHDASFAALVTHGLFQPFDYGDWDAEEVLAESTVDLDAMLLGDNHKPGVKRAEDGTWLTYCGSTERASADEREDRGYNIVTFDAAGGEGGEVTITRRGLPTREFRFVDVDLSEGEGVDRVRERVAEYDLTDAVTIVSIDGEGEPVAPAQVEEQVREAGALVVRVTDRREFDDAGGVEVSFADPDEAVRERVREMGLSPAARELDEVVRASKVADSTVAETVESRVEALLDGDGEADGAFDPAPETATETGGGPDASTAAERMAADAEEAGDDAADGEGGDAGEPEPEPDPAAAATETDGGGTADAGSPPDADDGEESTGAADDGQTDWGDFA
ncbi:DNA double-strand break repair protein Mre11 [Salinirubellus salinus]|uniref:DNA double-strand break repair protein Mre11 n=1 Tax=Salinirubellus salinus TaxID=1364945 RepID=A0A9E7UBV7_9EURY|nr:DNA double-strand break repair protein Mre11 [Salinirubellus salinus]UWM55562.1 DNA double-strand break repair protein Mre11 [Salinirubellus salinus]